MKKVNSVSLLVLGCAVLPLGILTKNAFILAVSIIINSVAIVLSFKEKKENN